MIAVVILGVAIGFLVGYTMAVRDARAYAKLHDDSEIIVMMRGGEWLP